MKLDVHGENPLHPHQALQSVLRELQPPIPKNQIIDFDNSPSFGNHGRPSHHSYNILNNNKSINPKYKY